MTPSSSSLGKKEGSSITGDDGCEGRGGGGQGVRDAEALEWLCDEYGHDDLVLNYHDACIYGRDLRILLRRDGWLNDGCIHYQFQRLQRPTTPKERSGTDAAVSRAATSRDADEAAVSGEDSVIKRKKIGGGGDHREQLQEQERRRKELFLDPAVLSFVMHQCTDDDDAEEFCRGHSYFADENRIYMAINDTMAPSSSSSWAVPGRGTHWSLLLADIASDDDEDDDEGIDPNNRRRWPSTTCSTRRRRLEFYHFDSVPGSNRGAALAVASKWERFIWPVATAKLRRRRPEGGTSRETSDTIVVECRAPRQNNGYDCGVHVLATARAISEHYRHRRFFFDDDSAAASRVGGVGDRDKCRGGTDDPENGGNDKTKKNDDDKTAVLERVVEERVGKPLREGGGRGRGGGSFCSGIRRDIVAEVLRMAKGE